MNKSTIITKDHVLTTCSKAALTALLLFVVMLCHAQMVDPVKFTAQLKTTSSAEAEIVFTGKIEPGWHVYSTNLGSGGPIEASFSASQHDGIELVGKLMPKGKELSKMDKMFGMNVRYFEHSVTFVQKIRFVKPHYALDCSLEYGACSDQTCMPPSEVSLKKQGKAPAFVADKDTKGAAAKDASTAAEARNAAIDESGADGGVATRPGEEMAVDSQFGVDPTADADSTAAAAAVDASASLTAADRAKLWTPVIKELQGFEQKTDTRSSTSSLPDCSAASSPCSHPACGPSYR